MSTRTAQGCIYDLTSGDRTYLTQDSHGAGVTLNTGLQKHCPEHADIGGLILREGDR